MSRVGHRSPANGFRWQVAAGRCKRPVAAPIVPYFDLIATMEIAPHANSNLDFEAKLDLIAKALYEIARSLEDIEREVKR